MWSYEVISDIETVPTMTSLGQPYVQEPSSQGAVSYLSFPTSFGIQEVRSYEPAVGVRCRVIRTQGDLKQECGGAVNSVESLRVTLDGEGWQ